MRHRNDFETLCMSSLLSYFSPPCVHVALHHPYSRAFKGPSEASEPSAAAAASFGAFAASLAVANASKSSCCCSPQQLLQVAAFHSHSKEDQIQGHLSSASKLGRPSTKAFSGLPRPQLAAAARAAGARHGGGPGRESSGAEEPAAITQLCRLVASSPTLKISRIPPGTILPPHQLKKLSWKKTAFESFESWQCGQLVVKIISTTSYSTAAQRSLKSSLEYPKYCISKGEVLRNGTIYLLKEMSHQKKIVEKGETAQQQQLLLIFEAGLCRLEKALRAQLHLGLGSLALTMIKVVSVCRLFQKPERFFYQHDTYRKIANLYLCLSTVNYFIPMLCQ